MARGEGRRLVDGLRRLGAGETPEPASRPPRRPGTTAPGRDHLLHPVPLAAAGDLAGLGAADVVQHRPRRGRPGARHGRRLHGPAIDDDVVWDRAGRRLPRARRRSSGWSATGSPPAAASATPTGPPPPGPRRRPAERPALGARPGRCLRGAGPLDVSVGRCRLSLRSNRRSITTSALGEAAGERDGRLQDAASCSRHALLARPGAHGPRPPSRRGGPSTSRPS